MVLCVRENDDMLVPVGEGTSEKKSELQVGIEPTTSSSQLRENPWQKKVFLSN